MIGRYSDADPQIGEWLQIGAVEDRDLNEDDLNIC